MKLLLLLLNFRNFLQLFWHTHTCSDASACVQICWSTFGCGRMALRLHIFANFWKILICLRKNMILYHLIFVRSRPHFLATPRPPPNRFTDRAAKNALAKGLAEAVLGRFRTVLHRFRAVSHHFRTVSDRSESFSDRFERRTLRKVRENLRKLRENSTKIRESLVQ